MVCVCVCVCVDNITSFYIIQKISSIDTEHDLISHTDSEKNNNFMFVYIVLLSQNKILNFI
jgi:hypothetical protein